MPKGQNNVLRGRQGAQVVLTRKVTSRGGTIRYFSLNAGDSVPIPDGHTVIVSKTGLPFLKKNQ